MNHSFFLSTSIYNWISITEQKCFCTATTSESGSTGPWRRLQIQGTGSSDLSSRGGRKWKWCVRAEWLKGTGRVWKERRQAKRSEGMHFLLSVHKSLGSSTEKAQVPSIHFLDSANSFYHAHTSNFSGESALGLKICAIAPPFGKQKKGFWLPICWIKGQSKTLPM